MNHQRLLALALSTLFSFAAMASAATHDVLISGYAFSPATLTVNVGDTVQWTNHDSAPHTVTATDNSFDSGYLATNATFSHVFTSAGSNPYACQFHPYMTATVVVQSPGGGHTGQFHDVAISGYAFQPSELHIAVGDTVRWTNNDSATHTATATGGEFNSGNLTNGQSYTHVFAVEGSFPYACNFHPGMTGTVVVGNSGGGQSAWVQQNSPTTLPLNDVRFWDDNFGWAAGEQGILRTTDRGENWTLSPTTDDVEAVFFVSATEGWACGNNGVLLYSANGGQSWQYQNSGVSDKLRDIWFIDAMKGWAVGRNGTLIHTADGGQNWSLQTSPTANDLYGIQMLDSLRGWTVGSGGLILYTGNGGANWIVQLSAPNGEEDEFEAVYALDNSHVWVAGGQGRIFYSSDGGQNWSQQASGTTVTLEDIFFSSSADGWVAGTGGFLGQWDGGMQMWMPSPAPSVAAFNSIYFVTGNLGFLVGGDGTIYKYDVPATGTNPRHEASIPLTPELFANYPNPFNPSTTIEFQLSAAGSAQLALFNVLGQQVAVLADGPMSAGLHRVQFSGSDFPSGLYFYQLRAGGQTFTRRMMLVK